MKLGLAKALVDRLMPVTASEVRLRLMVDMVWRTECCARKESRRTTRADHCSITLVSMGACPERPFSFHDVTGQFIFPPLRDSSLSAGSILIVIFIRSGDHLSCDAFSKLRPGCHDSLPLTCAPRELEITIPWPRRASREPSPSARTAPEGDEDSGVCPSSAHGRSAKSAKKTSERSARLALAV
jgi:hypothetical protein